MLVWCPIRDMIGDFMTKPLQDSVPKVQRSDHGRDPGIRSRARKGPARKGTPRKGTPRKIQAK